MEITPKISVIVPMYNVEKYLKLCLTSILNQTFKDFELILIDDCSTDNTLEVAKSFKDSRIKILRNIKNIGKPGPVRNVGMNIARGKYIYFCDSDDAILPNALETLYDAVEKFSADVATTFSWYLARNSEFQSLNDAEVEVRKASKIAPVSPDLKQRLYQEFLLRRIHIGPPFFLYLRKFLLDNNIRFLNEVAEDVFFNFDVLCATSKIVKFDVPYYIYRIHRNSASNNPNRLQKNIQSIPVLNNHIEKKLESIKDPNFVRQIMMFWVNHVMSTHITGYITPNGGGAAVTEILKGLEPRFGENSSFIVTLLCIYKSCIQQNRLLGNHINEIMQENQILKNRLENVNGKLRQENESLKITLKNIEQQISEVLKV